MKLSLRQRLWLPTLIVVTALLGVTTASGLRTRSLQAQAFEEQTRQDEKQSLTAKWVGLTATNAARATATLRSSDAGLESALKPEMQATSREIGDIQQRLQVLAVSEAEKGHLEKIAALRKDYMQAREKALAARTREGQEAARAVFESQVRPALDAYLTGQRELVELEDRLAAGALAAAGEQRMRTVYLAGAMAVGVSVLMLLASAWLIRDLLPALREVERTARAIGEGDMRRVTRTRREDELGAVLEALDATQDKLGSMVRDIRHTTESIATASTQIAVGNQDLSTRTEHTAGSLQQTASSMEQLTGTVRQTAESARTANQLVASASSTASQGGEVVAQVVSTMDEIHQASRKIADIIGVIDGIAFQTNILALNAAVEAARAGEQGRGFAVVASEVRNLAQRSAGAAREIKSLIQASSERVENGSRLVQQAGSTMNEIVSSVQRVTDVIGEITAAAAEQSDGIGQVNAAVVQLDHMTQQNAALVEESAAAAESLKSQAQRLSEAVVAFRTEAVPA